MLFAAGITLYNPSEKQIENALGYSDYFDRIFLFDNSDDGICRKGKMDAIDKVVYLDGNGNNGLPYAFNRILEKCVGYDFLCTLDQDSLFSGPDIEHIKKYIENKIDIKKCGIISPYVDYGIRTYTLSESIESKKWVITSGSFVNLNIIRKEELSYDENYFIDKFEIDLCQQLIVKDYEVLMYYGSVLHQELGDSNGHTHTNHSPLRHYYLFRNRFYFNKKWYKGIKRIFLNVAQTIRHLCLILLYENDKTRKIYQFVEAIKDFKNLKFGKKLL